MSDDEKHILQSPRRLFSATTKAEQAIDHVIETGKGHRHVQWGPNEKHSQKTDHELDELGQDSGAFSSLKRSLVGLRESRGRGPDTSPSQDLGIFIDANETEGLPTLTGQHELPKDSPRTPRFPSWGMKRRNKTKRETDDTSSRGKAALSDSTSFSPIQGTGILSALLATYDRGHYVSSGVLSSDTDTPLRQQATSQKRPRLSRLGSSLDNILNKINGSDIPEEAQTGAGVLGALIAATGNLSGIASPSHSAIGPDITKPGYRLSRYSISERPSSTPRSASNSRPPSIAIDSGAATPKGTKSADTSQPASPTSGTLRGRGWPAAVKTLTPGGSRRTSRHTSPNTTDTEGDGGHETRYRRKDAKRKRDDIFITMHVAHIIHRQDFILKMARAFMMFGAPSHRLESQLQTTGRILGLSLSCIYLPGVILISFNDSATGTSNLKFVKQGSALDLGKLIDAHALYWSVIHDEISVSDASSDLDQLMLRRQIYKGWMKIFPRCGNGIPLGALLVFVQNISAKNELYNNVFEIVIATLISFLAGALSSTGYFCYSAVASAAIVLILPGYIILCGILEVASRSITSGAVRLCYSIIYSLFLGFGIAMGAEVWRQVSGSTPLGNADILCTGAHHADGGWWQQQPSPYWAFLCTPMYALFLALRNQAPFWKKELYITWLFACAGWTANYFASQRFIGRKDISSAIGAFVVGVAGNLYGRFYQGNAFVVMLTGILFQLPTGLSSGGLLSIASQATQGNADAYTSGFQVAGQLVSVSVGLTVGLFIAAVAVHPLASRRRGTALFSL